MSSRSSEEIRQAQQTIPQQNQPLLQAFRALLQAQGLSSPTIRRHGDTIETLAMHLAEPGLLDEPRSLLQLEAPDLSSFLQDIAIYKKILLSRTQGLSVPTSLRLFVEWMGNHGHLTAEQVQECQEELQAEKAPYLEHFQMSLAQLAEEGVNGLDPSMLATQGWRDELNPALQTSANKGPRHVRRPPYDRRWVEPGEQPTSVQR